MKQKNNMLTILDFEDGLVYQYILETDKELQIEDLEKALINQGHKMKNCEWMLHSDETTKIKSIKL